MKIYTKTGDTGSTGLYGGTRVSKGDLRIDAYGTIDELNSWLGLLRDICNDTAISERLVEIQKFLFIIGTHLAADPIKVNQEKGTSRWALPKIDASGISHLEKEMDNMDQELEPMTHFILPGGHPNISYCHIARTVCRRAERLVVRLNRESTLDAVILPYLNRLSDYLFVLARKLSSDLGEEEIKWIP